MFVDDAIMGDLRHVFGVYLSNWVFFFRLAE